MRFGVVGVLCLAVVANVAVGQRVVLPFGTGGVTPSAEWTALLKADLLLEERASDPTDPVARESLRRVIGELRKNNRTEQNLVLHSSGAKPNQLRLINAYSADVAISSEELRGDEAIKQTSDALLAALAPTTANLAYVGHTPCDLFTIGEAADQTTDAATVPGVTLRFEYGDPPALQHLDMVMVPVGERLQYFECQYSAEDTGARAAIDALLGTFDGAKEKKSRVSNLLIGALAGAVAGVLTALIRRQRQARRMATSGSAAPPS